jgi:hypothetical protein
MPLKKIILIAFAIFPASAVFGQELPSISTDRPDQTESCYLVPARHIQWESGFNYEKLEGEVTKLVAPTILWRYALNRQLELRMVNEINRFEASDLKKQTGLIPLELGVKLHVAEKNGWIPQTAFIGHISIPDVATKDFRTSFIAPSFRFTMQHQLTDKMTLSYNLGMEWNGETPEGSAIYTLASGYSFTDKLGMYVELYGFMPEESKAAHNFDGGFTYLLADNMQLDISSGLGLMNSNLDHYFSLGFSLRLPH